MNSQLRHKRANLVYCAIGPASKNLDGRDLALLVGGPDGLSEACKQRAEQTWSLSALTLPHPLVRVVLAEQIYRAWSVTQGHPYHRD